MFGKESANQGSKELENIINFSTILRNLGLAYINTKEGKEKNSVPSCLLGPQPTVKHNPMLEACHNKDGLCPVGFHKGLNSFLVKMP